MKQYCFSSSRDRFVAILTITILIGPLSLAAVQSSRWKVEQPRLSELSEVGIAVGDLADVSNTVRPAESHVFLQLVAKFTPAPSSEPVIIALPGGFGRVDVSRGVSPSEIRLSGQSSKNGTSSMWSVEPIVWADVSRKGNCPYTFVDKPITRGTHSSNYMVWFLVQPGAPNRLVINGKRAKICLVFDVPAGTRSKLSLMFGGTDVLIR